MALVLLAGVLVVACTVGSDDSTPSDATGPAVTVGPEVENFDSFRGVTADTIRVGITVADFDALQDLGIQNYWGDGETAYQPFIDAINESGGIHGRQIEPHYADFNYLTPESQDAACVELTQDDQVFIVLNGFLSESNLCLTETNETMVMTTSFQTEELVERSGDTLWLSMNAVGGAGTQAMAQALADSGRLDGKTIGIILNGALQSGTGDDVPLQDTLTDLGYESTVAITAAPIDDEVAREDELDVIIQRFISEDVDFIFSLLGGGDVYDNLAAADYHPEVADGTLGAAVEGAEDPSLMDGVFGVGGRSDDEVWADPAFMAACSDVVLEAHPDLEDQFEYVPTGEQQANGEPNWLGPIRDACAQTMLLQQLGEIAGGSSRTTPSGPPSTTWARSSSPASVRRAFGARTSGTASTSSICSSTTPTPTRSTSSATRSSPTVDVTPARRQGQPAPGMSTSTASTRPRPLPAQSASPKPGAVIR